jgi:hypothetical protein
MNEMYWIQNHTNLAFEFWSFARKISLQCTRDANEQVEPDDWIELFQAVNDDQFEKTNWKTSSELRVFY